MEVVMSNTIILSNVEWEKVRLEEICDVRDGTHDSPKKVVIGKPLITSRHIRNGKIDFASSYNISIEDFNEVNKRSKVDIYDILFSMIGTIAETTIVDFAPNFAIKNIGLFKTNRNQELAKWIYYYLKSNQAKAEINASFKGSTQQYITLGDLRKFPILLPPLPEQKAISEVLSSLDDKIDLLHRQNKTLEQMAETLFRQWFQPAEASAQAGVEEAKEDWDKGVLPDEFDFLMGQSPKGSSFNEEGIGLPMYQGNADFDFRFPNRRIYTTEAKRLAQKFDTLISVRAPVGEQNMALEECCIGRGVAAFKYKSNSDYYTYTYFKIRSLINDIKQFNNEGTVFGSISKTDFQALSITIPPKKLVDKFQNEVKQIDDKVIQNSIQIRTLEKMRDTLLPKLMSGEVKVM